MMRALRLVGFLVFMAVFSTSATQAGEKNVQPVAVDKKDRDVGNRHLYIDKLGIAERTQARMRDRPAKENPNAGRGFLLERVQGGHGSGKLKLEKLRRRQIESYERRRVASSPAVPLVKNDEIDPGRAAKVADPDGDYSGIVCACGALIAAAFVVLRRRRGRQETEKKKARKLY